MAVALRSRHSVVSCAWRGKEAVAWTPPHGSHHRATLYLLLYQPPEVVSFLRLLMTRGDRDIQASPHLCSRTCLTQELRSCWLSLSVFGGRVTPSYISKLIKSLQNSLYLDNQGECLVEIPSEVPLCACALLMKHICEQCLRNPSVPSGLRGLLRLLEGESQASCSQGGPEGPDCCGVCEPVSPFLHGMVLSPGWLGM